MTTSAFAGVELQTVLFQPLHGNKLKETNWKRNLSNAIQGVWRVSSDVFAKSLRHTKRKLVQQS